MVTKILTDRTNFSRDVKDVRQEWLRDLLTYIGLDTEAMEEMERDEILDYFLDQEIEIIEYKSIDAIEVRFEGELVGEWAGPEFELKEDSNGSLFFEATIEHWSIIEDEINE